MPQTSRNAGHKGHAAISVEIYATVGADDRVVYRRDRRGIRCRMRVTVL